MGCGDPEQNTDLRASGPPEVTTILVMTDAVSQLNEQATYCAADDNKRPDIVGLPDFTLQRICDDDLAVGASMVTNAYPDGWYIRVVFDELLDPNVEELIEILDPDTGEGTDTFTGTLANTQPVTLECESVAGGFVNVSYDGYYSPAGNRLTWPLGPSLVIKPNDPTEVATTKMCRVTIKDSVVDKSGEVVPADQRGPYQFKIAPITPIFIDPSDGSEVDALAIYFDNVYTQFNTAPTESSFCNDGVGTDECEFKLTPNIGQCAISGAVCDVDMAGACPGVGDSCDGGYYHYSLGPFGFTDAEYGFGPNVPLETEKDYTFSFLQGFKITDRCGVETTFGAPSADDQSETTFTTAAFSLNSITPGTGDTVNPLTRPKIQFNNVLKDFDPTTELAAGTEYTLVPAPTTPSVGTVGGSGGEAVFYGFYQPATMYTLTLKAGAVVNDYWDKPFSNAADRTVTWMTNPIALTSTTPANNGTSTKATPTSTTTIRLNFNQAMDATSLATTGVGAEVTLTDSSMAAIPLNPVAGVVGCSTTASTCSVTVTTVAFLPPGDYTFTLNAGAQILDAIGNNYAQAAARVVNFTVVEAGPPPPAHICL